MLIATGEPVAREVVEMIRAGRVEALAALLAEHPGLAAARLGDADVSRPLLHVATDWPGHLPRVAETVAVLVAAGADVHARFAGPHEETALHWAASCDDVAALDALLDAGADIEAAGAVVAGGTPLQDARAFRCWATAQRLVERGARVDRHDAATLGLVDRLRDDLPPAGDELDTLFWSACHGGRLDAARLLHAAGAAIDAVASWEPRTALDAAATAGTPALVTWLREQGAHLHDELPGGCLAP